MAVADKVVMTHIDADGVGSAAVLKMRYGIESKNIFFSGHSRDDTENATRRILRLCGKGTTLYVTDISVNAALVQKVAHFVREVKRRGGSVVWLDHHVWTGKAINAIARQCSTAIVGENSIACATDIAVRYTGLDSAFVRRFADVVHNVDFAKKQKSAWAEDVGRVYSSAISYFNSGRPHDERQRNQRYVVDVIASGRFLDGRLRKAASRFDSLSKVGVAAMLKTVVSASKNVAVGFSDAVMVDSNDACDAIRKKTGSDAVVFVEVLKRSASIRSRRNDVSRLAAEFGGGGHPHASGFNFAKRYSLETERDRARFVKEIGRKASRIGIR